MAAVEEAAIDEAAIAECVTKPRRSSGEAPEQKILDRKILEPKWLRNFGR